MSKKQHPVKAASSGLVAIADMLRSDDKWQSKSKNYITLLARRIMYDIDLKPRNFLNRIEVWLEKLLGIDESAKKAIATSRHNFYNEITKDTMTVKSFEKFTQAIGARKVTIIARLEFDDGRQDVESTISFINHYNGGLDETDIEEEEE